MPKKNNLQVLRLRRRLSQKQLADMCGISQSIISRYEAYRKISPAFEKRIAEALGVHPDILYCDVTLIPDDDTWDRLTADTDLTKIVDYLCGSADPVDAFSELVKDAFGDTSEEFTRLQDKLCAIQ